MKKIIFITISLHLTASGIWAQDTGVVVKGLIIDASTREPVVAQIKYESLPYGSKIGLFSDSIFNFSMEPGLEYRFSVSADGYSPHYETFKPDSSDTAQKLIELKPSGSNRLIRLERLIFDLGKATINETSHEELDELVAMLEVNQSMQIQLEGHTDFRGNEKLNLKLSEDRVNAVRAYLVGKGIDKRRIKTKAFGGEKPLSRGSDAESRSRNRRVEVRILSN